MPARTLLISYDLEAPHVEAVRSALPGWHIVQHTDPDAVREAATTAEIILGSPPPTDRLSESTQLRWVHAPFAGVDSWDLAALQTHNILVSNSRGAHGPQIAELILGMALCFATGLRTLISAQADNGGPPTLRHEVTRRKFELGGQTIGIIGIGTIGQATARAAHGLGMRVIAVRRTPTGKSSTLAPIFVELLSGPDGLPNLLRRSDHVVLCLPLTADTTGLIGAAELRMMRSTAYLYNIGRGSSIDQAALEQALREGWIAGAGLDVTVPDPPDPDSPLWHLPNVILSQHTSGSSPHTAHRVTEIFLRNVAAYLKGDPLPTQVDPQAGY